ncbi:FAD-binding domain-containing protein [Halovulum sp. GXIMD14794]
MSPEQATRDQAYRRVESFKSRMGLEYEARRNYDHGPGRHDDVSRLSPYIRRRLITEQEVVAIALAQHGPKTAQKFVQEVLWRTYFKGWLEHRPIIWTRYAEGLHTDLGALEADGALRRKIDAAESGNTGLDCFDAWSRELVETGYLHNHARMWFASIWIFTFGLPWRIGADFFHRHLLDGDPASNTCSWRWVAGLHTPGKAYMATAANIAEFTSDRLSPRDEDLTPTVSAPLGEEPDGLPPVSPLRAPHAPNLRVPTILVFTEDDCTLEDFDINTLDIRAAVMLSSSHLRSPRKVSARVNEFEAGALRDAASRAGVDATARPAADPNLLAVWAEAAGARQVAMPYVPVGPLSDWVGKARPALEAKGIALTEWRRGWDELIWPHATAGFFKVKKKIPEILWKAGLI